MALVDIVLLDNAICGGSGGCDDDGGGGRELGLAPGKPTLAFDFAFETLENLRPSSSYVLPENQVFIAKAPINKGLGEVTSQNL
ncbi:uncharacterized protein G2W53_033566 [Senna tora]|uniref:Uncharacterized protein n=1 Tax=Senna tora TaxID=362788 RepID=A0A834SYJ9_9FABA|nr:uncharacterized protein G2W53_033566 [Senna tora]